MSVLEYIEEKMPPEVQRLLIAAHDLLQETLPPSASCAIKWHLPVYSLNRIFCYINRHKDHITIGFWQGFKLSPKPGVLLDENGKLKQIRYLEIRRIEELYSDTFLQILQEAIMLDEMFPGSKTKKRRITKS